MEDSEDDRAWGKLGDVEGAAGDNVKDDAKDRDVDNDMMTGSSSYNKLVVGMDSLDIDRDPPFYMLIYFYVGISIMYIHKIYIFIQRDA